MFQLIGTVSFCIGSETPRETSYTELSEPRSVSWGLGSLGVNYCVE